MNTFIKRALLGTLLAGGITLLGSVAAHADTLSGPSTDGHDGLLSGTQAVVNLDAPITVAGNALSVLGGSHASGSQTAAPAASTAPAAPAAAPTTNGSHGAASGTQALVSVHVPVTVGGNAVSVLGDARSRGAKTAASAPATAPASTAAPATTGSRGVASGTQGLVDIAVPVTVGGNAVSVLGDSRSTDAASTTSASRSGTAAPSTSGVQSIAGGTQVVAPVRLPVTVSGNAVSVLGDSSSTGAVTNVPATDAGTASADPLAPITSGLGSLLGGTQLAVPLEVPVTVGGNAVSVVGDSTSTGTTTGGTDPGDGGTTPGDGGTTPGDGDTGGTTPGGTSTGGTQTGGTSTGGVTAQPASLITSAAPAAATTSAIPAESADLAETGGTIPFATLFAAIALVGAGVVLVSRRRRTA